MLRWAFIEEEEREEEGGLDFEKLGAEVDFMFFSVNYVVIYIKRKIGAYI